VKKSLLPLEISAEKPTYNILTNYEPSAEDVFNDIAPKYISGVIYCAIIDSFAAEQAERRMAMDNATENADEMISDLSLKYNRARQASITQEINEIVGGAAGL
jgi:F-type H+-transporting ATPase subunit gamma